MGLNGVSSLLDTSSLKPLFPKTRSKDSKASSGIAMSDVVYKKDQNYAFKVYFEATIKRLNAIVGEAAAKLGVDLETVDTSPEATSDRIVGFAVSMYPIYKKQHPELDDGEALSRFDGLIRKAVDKGFSEAIKIIQGLSIDSPGIMADIQATYGLVQQKLDNFFSSVQI